MTAALSEHISYLSLPGRRRLYDDAIAKVLGDGDIVADLGCGVGVLGLQCLAAGAARVYGIDSSAAIHLARQTVERAGLKDRYRCISGSTFEVSLPEAVDLLICDHIGFFGFDYGIVEMLRDARARFLKPGGRMMPDRLKLEVAALSSDNCREIITKWCDEAVPGELHWLAEQAANTKHGVDLAPEDLCSSPVLLGEIDLVDDGSELFSFSAEIPITRSGQFHGLAGWFDAHLGGDVWMTNSPLEERSIKRSQAFLPVSQPFEVSEGDTVKFTLRARFEGELLFWSVEPPNGGARQNMSTWASTIFSAGDLMEGSDEPVELSTSAETMAYVLSLADGVRSLLQIEDEVIAARPGLRPTEAATREYVRKLLARNVRQ